MYYLKKEHIGEIPGDSVFLEHYRMLSQAAKWYRLSEV